LLVNEAKMAKRLGNFITVSELREKGVDGKTVRFLLLSGHYRAQLNFTEKSLEQAGSSVKRINEFVARLEDALVSASEGGTMEGPVRELIEDTRERYVTSLENDLEAPSALAAIFDFIKEGNRFLDLGASSSFGLQSMLDFMRNDFDKIFGVLYQVEDSSRLSPEQKTWLDERERARASKEWTKSDELRVRLLATGIEVQDTPQGQKWRLLKS
jgi:cysteinyl-tRNA synthetase